MNTAPSAPQLPLALYSAWLSMHRVSQRALRRIGLTLPQYLVMQELAQHPAMSVSQIGEALFLDSATLSPLLKRLDHCGLISRKRGVADERVLLVALTPSGFKLLSDAEANVGQIVEAVQPAGEGGDDLVEQLNALRSTLLELG